MARLLPYAPAPIAPCAAAVDTVVMNSLLHTAGTLGAGAVVEHSELWGDWRVGAGSLVSGVRSVPGLVVEPGIAVQEVGMGNGTRVLTLHGTHDKIKAKASTDKGTFCGVPWAVCGTLCVCGPALLVASKPRAGVLLLCCRSL